MRCDCISSTLYHTARLEGHSAFLTRISRHERAAELEREGLLLEEGGGTDVALARLGAEVPSVSEIGSASRAKLGGDLQLPLLKAGVPATGTLGMSLYRGGIHSLFA